MCTRGSKVCMNPFFNHAQSIGEGFKPLAVKVPEIQRGDSRFFVLVHCSAKKLYKRNYKSLTCTWNIQTIHEMHSPWQMLSNETHIAYVIHICSLTGEIRSCHVTQADLNDLEGGPASTGNFSGNLAIEWCFLCANLKKIETGKICLTLTSNKGHKVKDLKFDLIRSNRIWPDSLIHPLLKNV